MRIQLFPCAVMSWIFAQLIINDHLWQMRWIQENYRWKRFVITSHSRSCFWNKTFRIEYMKDESLKGKDVGKWIVISVKANSSRCCPKISEGSKFIDLLPSKISHENVKEIWIFIKISIRQLSFCQNHAYFK